MITVYEKDNTRLLKYVPTIAKPLYTDFEPLRLIRRIRLLLELLGPGKYDVYYLEKYGDLVGYCVVTPGGRRLKCSTKKDIVLGPYYVKESERGKGYSVELIRLVLECTNYEFAYDWIEKTNIASRKASERCGFKPFAELNVSRFLRRLTIVKSGDDIVYRYQKQKAEE